MSKTWAELGIEIPSGRSGEIDTTCPRCSPNRKKKNARCLSINTDKGVWSCAHCGWSGGLVTGEQRYQPAWSKPVYRKPDPPKDLIEIDPIVEWFKSRGISKEVIERNKIFGATIYMPQVEERRGAICFPYFRNGEVINYKYRDREKNFRMETQAERILYGYDDIHDEICVIVEGEIDKLSVEMTGVTLSCVSVPDGAPSPNTKDYASKFSFLDDERLERVKEWVIAVDSDAPGVRLEHELVRRLGIEKCRRVIWPESEDKVDANSILVESGPERLKEILLAAQPYPVEGVIDVKDVSTKLDFLWNSGLVPGISTSWKTMDPFYTVRPGEWTVVTGIPSSGKSNWVDALIVNLAREHDWKFAVFSPENQPIENHISRLLEHYTRMPFRDGPTLRMTLDEMHSARDWANRHFHFILPPDDAAWTVSNVLEMARILVRRHGINGIVIDPWNEMEHSRPREMSETEYISKTLKHIRQFARRNIVHIWLVAHPAKLYRNKDGNYPIPTLYDISGSSHWRNKADNGIVVWRDFAYPDSPRVQIHIQKIRFREVGKIGMVELRYDVPTGGYYDLAPAANPYPTYSQPVGDEEQADDEELPF